MPAFRMELAISRRCSRSVILPPTARREEPVRTRVANRSTVAASFPFRPVEHSAADTTCPCDTHQKFHDLHYSLASPIVSAASVGRYDGQRPRRHTVSLSSTGPSHSSGNQNHANKHSTSPRCLASRTSSRRRFASPCCVGRARLLQFRCNRRGRTPATESFSADGARVVRRQSA